MSMDAQKVPPAVPPSDDHWNAGERRVVDDLRPLG